MSHGAFGQGIARPLQDFDLAVSLGTVRNTNGNPYQTQTLFGRNDTIGVSPPQAMRPSGGSYFFGQEPLAVRIRAGGNVNDTALGTGANAIVIEGIDSSFNLVQTILPTNGALVSGATTELFWRTNFVFVASVGVYGGANAGIITLEDTDGNFLLDVQSLEGISQSASLGTPGSHTAVLQAILLVVEGTKEVTFQFNARTTFDQVAAPFLPILELATFKNVPQGVHVLNLVNPVVLPEKSDFFVTANTAVATSAAFSSAAVKLVPNK